MTYKIRQSCSAALFNISQSTVIKHQKKINEEYTHEIKILSHFYCLIDTVTRIKFLESTGGPTLKCFGTYLLKVLENKMDKSNVKVPTLWTKKL